MDIGEWVATPELNQTVRDARRLGLEQNLFELEAYGFTVVPPERVGAGDLPKRMFDQTMRLCEEVDRAGGKMSGPGHATWDYSHFLHYLIGRDPVFIEAVMHPVTLTLARYLLGASCRLFTTSTFVKKGTVSATPMHVDSAGNPPPLYPFSVVCNISWILTDYTEANGTFAIVPGSHRYCRHPTQAELPKVMGGTGDNICIPVEAKAGSLIVFTGNTWHGTYPKTDPVLRAHVVTGFCRNYVLPAENYRDFPEAVVAEHGSEFARLLGRTAWQGYTLEGPKGENVAAMARPSQTPSA
jgi:ectoine hydroxylase-related dioxygenase (phytanoyl-CoA dioxygenase family)